MKSSSKSKEASSTEQVTSKKALLVATYKGAQDRKICDEHLTELELLSRTYGIEVVAKVPCALRKIEASTFISSGKLEEIQEMARQMAVDTVIFDEEISPAQQRNLERALQVKVMDRTEVIIGVFAQRAQTKEARLQIELAQVKYQYPRLKNLWSHLSRQQGSGGGGMYLKGEGEKQIEIDRRLLKQRIERLQSEIATVKLNRETQRGARMRSEIPVFAIIGYTNAGKSTLLNALTDANVLTEDKLFATLDTTTRKFTLQNNQDILLIDTVGFIRKLPHLLVAAFKSTLEEAIQADFLLHLVDVSHPMAEEQAETSFLVLKELNAAHKPVITVLNKIDCCENMGMIQRMRIKYPKTVGISALNKEGFEDLQEMMIQELQSLRKRILLRIPQKDYAFVSEVMRQGKVISQTYEENDIFLKAELPVALLGRLKKYLIEG